jgi:hypothetical protein
MSALCPEHGAVIQRQPSQGDKGLLPDRVAYLSVRMPRRWRVIAMLPVSQPLLERENGIQP